MIKPSTGHSVMLACDHGYFMGPTHRLENPKKTIEPLLPFADTLAVTRGYSEHRLIRSGTLRFCSGSPEEPAFFMKI